MSDPTMNPIARKSVLIIEGSVEHFCEYAADILKAEGLNGFQTEPLKTMRLDFLQKYSIILLTKTELNMSQANILRKYVYGGGCLIAFQPEHQIGDIFGISFANTTIDGGYLRIDTDTQIGAGLTPKTLRIHDSADGYKLRGATPVADLIQPSQNLISYPAVVSYDYGNGHSIAFSYNLPQNVHNQADEQMRLLSNTFEYLSSLSSPLIRSRLELPLMTHITAF